MITGVGAIEVATPRDRKGSFEPKILPKHERRFAGFDQKILSMYARGMSTRDIQKHLEENYAVEVSPSLISEVTEAVMEEVRAWQSRPLDSLYPIVYLDALMVSMRQEGRVENRAIFVALDVNIAARKTTPPTGSLLLRPPVYFSGLSQLGNIKWQARYARCHKRTSRDEQGIQLCSNGRFGGVNRYSYRYGSD